MLHATNNEPFEVKNNLGQQSKEKGISASEYFVLDHISYTKQAMPKYQLSTIKLRYI